MTIEEAIKNREWCLKYLERNPVTADPSIVEAVRMSIAALHDQQPLANLDRIRWEWCSYCTFGTEGLLQREVKYGMSMKQRSFFARSAASPSPRKPRRN